MKVIVGIGLGLIALGWVLNRSGVPASGFPLFLVGSRLWLVIVGVLMLCWAMIRYMRE